MTAQQLREVISKVVREELSKQLKPLMNEVLAQMLVEMVANRGTPINEGGLPSNSRKAQMLREASYMNPEELEEYPTMTPGRPTRAQLAEMMGYGDMNPGGGVQPGMITVDSMMGQGEAGAPIPIPASAIPKHVLEAFNRDYRPMMQKVNAMKR